MEKALIIDFDLHYGDRTANTFAGNPAVVYRHVTGRDSASFVNDLETFLDGVRKADLLAVSAGFDRHVKTGAGSFPPKTTDPWEKFWRSLPVKGARGACLRHWKGL